MENGFQTKYLSDEDYMQELCAMIRSTRDVKQKKFLEEERDNLIRMRARARFRTMEFGDLGQFHEISKQQYDDITLSYGLR